MKILYIFMFFITINSLNNYIEAYCIRFSTPLGIKNNVHIVIRDIKELSDLKYLYDSNSSNYKFIGSERKFIKIIDKKFFTNIKTKCYCINNLRNLFNNHVITYHENKIFFKEGFLFDGILIPNIAKILIILRTIDEYKLNFDGRSILPDIVKEDFHSRIEPLVEENTNLLVSIFIKEKKIIENVVKISEKFIQLFKILDNLLEIINKREIVNGRLIYVKDVIKILKIISHEHNSWLSYMNILNNIYHCDVLIYILKKLRDEIEVSIVFYQNLLANGNDKGILGHYWRLTEFHRSNFNNFTKSLIIKKLFIRREVIKDILINFIFSTIDHTIKKNILTVVSKETNYSTETESSNMFVNMRNQILENDISNFFMIM